MSKNISNTTGPQARQTIAQSLGQHLEACVSWSHQDVLKWIEQHHHAYGYKVLREEDGRRVILIRFSDESGITLHEQPPQTIN